MAKKKITPEEAAAQAEKAKPATKSAKPSAQEMSGGAVKPKPKPNAAAKGVEAMKSHIDPNAGTPPPAAAASTAAESGAASTAAESGAAKMASTAESAASTAAKTSSAAGKVATVGGKVIKGALSPAALVPLATYAADTYIPRADDSTDLGYNVNTARDVATSAANTAALAPLAMRLLRLKNPYLIAGAAALAGGKALYDRLSGYHAANPEADDQYQYQLPQAKVNFWEQAPAAVSDAGHVASQVLRGVGEGIDYGLNNYTLGAYPALKRGAAATADYFTPEAMKPQPVSEEEVAQSQQKLQEMKSAEPSWRQVAYPDDPTGQKRFQDAVEGNPKNPGFEMLPAKNQAPERIRRKADGSYETDIYREDGTYAGRAGGTKPQLEEFQRRRRADEEARRKFEDALERLAIEGAARRKQQEKEDVERHRRFVASVDSRREMERLAGPFALNGDPLRTRQRLEDLKLAIETQAESTGRSVDDILSTPEMRKSPAARAVRDIMEQERQLGRRLLPAETQLTTLANMPVDVPNYYGDDETYSQAKSKQALTTAGALVGAQDKAEARQLADDKLGLQTRNAELEQTNRELIRSAERNREDRLSEKDRRAAEAALKKEHADALNDRSSLLAKANDPDVKLDPQAKAQFETMLTLAQQRVQAAQAALEEAGIGLPELEDGPTGAVTGPPAPVVTKVVDGKTYIQQNGTWFGPI